jgi:hypothetical protein
MHGQDIFEKLKKENKESILFRYDKLKDFEELRLLSLYLMNKTTDGICFTPTGLDYLHNLEEKQSREAISKGITNFKSEDVHYSLSELGYRISNPLEQIKNSTGVFGCSYTFGVGMPYEKTYSSLLQNKLKEPVYNFGIPGGNIQKIAKAFCSLNNFYRLDKAIFVLPSVYRYEFIKEDSGYLYQEDFIPNFPPYNNPSIYKMLYEEFDDVTFFNEYIKNINLIRYNAKISGTKTYITSWCKTTLDLVKKYDLDLFNVGQVRFVESEESHAGIDVKDFARDGYHPGIRSHALSADLIYNVIVPPKDTKKLI